MLTNTLESIGKEAALFTDEGEVYVEVDDVYVKVNGYKLDEDGDIVFTLETDSE